MFGNGMGAAAGLRARMLELLGAESEWIDGEHEHAQMIWKPGLPTTFFIVRPASEETPDLGVLRVETPLVAAEDEAAALEYCATAGGLTSRWAVVSRENSPGSMQLSCSFVVGPHNVDALAGYAAWCVREQVAQASAALWNDVIGQVNGGNWTFPQFEGRDRRDPGAWNEAVRHLDHLIFPNKGLPSGSLLEEMRGALDGLLRQMRADGTGEWSVSEEHGDDGFLLEMPLSWQEYPDGMIAVSGERPLPTASVAVMPVSHPSLGNGLSVSLVVPWHLTAVPGDEAAAVVNRLNQLDTEQPGTTHGIGGWSMADPGPMYYLFLPAVLAEKAGAQGIDLGFVMREILLTRFDFHHLAMSRLYDSYELVLYDVVEDPDLNARFPELPPVPCGPDMIGRWRRMPEGLAYGVVLPPASLIWPDHDPVVDMLSWAGRHIISRVREAFEEETPNER